MTGKTVSSLGISVKPSKCIHPKNDTCGICQNVGKLSKIDADHSRKLKLYALLQIYERRIIPVVRGSTFMM